MDSEIKILHVIDDEKFIKYCKATFSVPAVENIYCKSAMFKEHIKNDLFFDIVILHYLNNDSIQLLNEDKIKQPVIWFFWGGDAFSLGKFYNSFLLPKTKRISLKLAFNYGIQNGIKEIIKRIFPKIIDLSIKNKLLIKSLKKISIIIPIVPGDFELLSKAYSIKAWNYNLHYINPVFKNTHIPSINDNNILLGNSASYTNNHIEIIDTLSKIDLGNRKVIIPLGYGNENYANYIKDYAEKKLQNVICLMNFLPYEKYQGIIQSCSIVIMNHLRQQALGNIVLSLLMGAHLYMQSSSTVFQYLIKESFYVSSVKEISNFKVLTKTEKQYNRRKCEEVFGEATQQEKVIQLIEMVMNSNKSPVS